MRERWFCCFASFDSKAFHSTFNVVIKELLPKKIGTKECPIPYPSWSHGADLNDAHMRLGTI